MPDRAPKFRSSDDASSTDTLTAPTILWNRIRAAEQKASEAQPLVLVVEDQASDRLLMQYALRHEVRTDSATTVEDAVRMATTTRYDAILVTDRLPDDTGMSVLKRLQFRSAYRHVPIVIVTAHALAGDRERFLDAGFDAYVAKPFTLDQIATLVRDLLGDDVRRPDAELTRKAS